MRITTGIIKNIRIYVFIRGVAYNQTNDLSLERVQWVLHKDTLHKVLHAS